MNARSLLANFNEIELLCTDLKPSILACSETRITNELNESEYKIDGYNVIVCLSKSRHTGGVVMYIKENIKYRIVHNEVLNEHLWFLSIEIWQGCTKGIYNIFYRSPDKKFKSKDIVKIMNEYLHKVIDLSKLNIIMGDLNVNLNKEEALSTKMKNVIMKYGMNVINNFNTRINTNTETKIDVILTNRSDEIVCKVMNDEHITDHETILVTITGNTNDNKQVNKILSWRDYSREKLISNLSKRSWSEFDKLSLETKIMKIRENIYDSTVPFTKMIRINDKIKPKKWYDSELREMKMKKIELSKKSRQTKLESDNVAYKNIRNEFTRILNQKKSDHNKQLIIRASNDQKSMWKCLNNLTKIKKKKTCDTINFNGTLCSNDRLICEKFNSYFIESIVEIDKTIPNESDVRQIDTNFVYPKTFKFELVNVDTINEISNKLTKKVDKSQILNSNVWHDALQYTGYFLTMIINESLLTGEVPDIWKVATVHPIPKVKNTNKASEFRPINTMPVDEKIIESVVKAQLTKYVEENNILNSHQSAFRKGHSCETTLNSCIHNWAKDIENGYVIIVIFLDLRRAFETVNRKRMLYKLKKMGITENELKWFENYLKHRKQKTKYNNEYSSEEEIPIGLPQGTALSVLLFILYINDIVNVTDHSNIEMFADDTAITIKEKTFDKASALMNIDLRKIYKWLNENKLKLNIDKTKCMIFSKKTISTEKYLTFAETKIERVDKIKYLGVIINEKLKCNDQIQKCVSKAASKVNLLKRLSKKLNFSSRKLVYNSLIQPNFDYCSTLYLNATKEQIKCMQKIQNRGMRTILKCHYLTPKKYMLDCLGWLSISQRIKFNCIVMIFKIKHDLLPEYLKNELNYVCNMSNRNLRNAHDFRLPNYKLDVTRKSIFYDGIKLFNGLPQYLKEISSLTKFKSECKKYILQSFPVS